MSTMFSALPYGKMELNDKTPSATVHKFNLHRRPTNQPTYPLPIYTPILNTITNSTIPTPGKIL